MRTDWQWPGSRWWRVDLHTHTPASYDFGEEADRKTPDWSRWIRSAQAAELQAVAITDHNSAQGIEGVKNAAARLEGCLTVLPGVEVTAGCGTHLLFVLDPSAGAADVDDFLSKVSISPDKRGSREARSTMSVEQILALGVEHRGVFVAAHVNKDAGLLRHDGQQRIQELRHPHLAGVEVDPDCDLDETWLDGRRPEIGRRLPRLWCSDAHRFGDLGRRFTWVKMTRPDLEGLRLALLDGGESSLRPARGSAAGDPNRHASLVIEKVTVLAAKHMGRPDALEFRFNPWLNTISAGVAPESPRCWTSAARPCGVTRSWRGLRSGRPSLDA